MFCAGFTRVYEQRFRRRGLFCGHRDWREDRGAVQKERLQSGQLSHRKMQHFQYVVNKMEHFQYVADKM